MCDCITKENIELGKRNSQVLIPAWGPQRMMVKTVKVDVMRHRKPMELFASFCPLCGEKYEALEEVDEARRETLAGKAAA